MQTFFSEKQLTMPDISDADQILRSCVHCGFCNAVCPTYQLFGDESYGPRGRIYLIKQLLENGQIGKEGVRALDLCLTCRSCESTCPSGVDYARLLEIGKAGLSKNGGYSLFRKLLNQLLGLVVPYSSRFGVVVWMGRLLSFMLPRHQRALLGLNPAKKKFLSPVNLAQTTTIDRRHKSKEATETKTSRIRKIILLEGCVQKTCTPEVNLALRRILDCFDIGVHTISDESCCGALDQHLPREDQAKNHMRGLIDQLWSKLKSWEGTLSEAADIADIPYCIVSTASGCGGTIKEYDKLLAHDESYASKARQIALLTRDASELIAELAGERKLRCASQKVALHLPCSLQHVQKLGPELTALLRKLGFDLVEVRDQHLCCGSAGSYSLFHPLIGEKLRDEKMGQLLREVPEVIVTANIGCQLHLSGASEAQDIPVMHWLELVAASILDDTDVSQTG